MAVRVAIDTGSLVGARTGVGQFVQHLLPALAALDDAPEVVPYVLSMRAPLPDGTRRLPFPAGLALRAWAHGDQPSAERSLTDVDVVHGPNYVVPPSRRPTLVSVHDCWFLRHPEDVSPAVQRFEPALRRAVARGTVVHVPSHHTAREVRELLGADRVVVRPLGALPVRASTGAPMLAGLDGRPYLLALGAKEPRKNLPRLVEAFGLVAERRDDLALVLLGPPGRDQPAVHAAVDALPRDLAHRVLLVDWVEDDRRDAVLAGATALVMPSLDEGWGFPVLEAMSAGVPVVAARAGSLPEVGGDAALYVDPLDPADLAAGIARAVGDDALRASLVAAGGRRVAELDLASCAAGFAELYRSLSRAAVG